jgi:peptide/nickel transport system substrate-binding protein
MNFKNILILFGLSLTGVTQAVEPYSKKAGQSYLNLPATPKGGTLYSRLGGNPKALNPWLASDTSERMVSRYLYAPLMCRDYDTTEYFSCLAEKADVSKDYKTYTFTLRKDAVWEDGTPITTDDVQFSYDRLWDEKVDAAPMRAYFGAFKFEKVDAQTFRFIVEDPNVNTLLNFNDDFMVMQKKQFDGVTDFNKAKGIIQPVSSGPYRLKTFSRDQKIELERKKDWWGYKIPQMKSLYNFDQIVFRIIPDTALAYEKFIKGEIDVLEMNAEMFGTRVKGSDKDKFGSGPTSDKPIWAEHFKTDAPVAWTYVGWNLKKPQFSSKKTRQALAMLIDYDQIIDRVYAGEAVRSYSPFGSSTPNTAPDQKSRAFKFDPAKALKLLQEDGWKDNGAGQLEREVNGKKMNFEFTLRYNSENPMRSKVAQMLKEQFKRAGIMVNVQAMEWNTLIAEVGNRNFDAIVLGWGPANLNSDANQLWHSKSYENKGSNYTGYSNPDVDALIGDSIKEMDPKKRFKILQKIGTLIYDDQPYAFIAEIPGFMMGAHSRIKSRKWVMKYSDVPPVFLYYSE